MSCVSLGTYKDQSWIIGCQRSVVFVCEDYVLSLVANIVTI